MTGNYYLSFSESGIRYSLAGVLRLWSLPRLTPRVTEAAAMQCPGGKGTTCQLVGRAVSKPQVLSGCALEKSDPSHVGPWCCSQYGGWLPSEEARVREREKSPGWRPWPFYNLTSKWYHKLSSIFYFLETKVYPSSRRSLYKAWEYRAEITWSCLS